MRMVLVAVSAALLAGCSSSGHGGRSSPGGLPPHPTSGPKADRVFLSVVRPDFPATVSDTILVRLAHDMCGDFDRGVDWAKEVAVMINDGGVPAKAAGGFIAAAVGTYCPDNVSALPGH